MTRKRDLSLILRYHILFNSSIRTACNFDTKIEYYKYRANNRTTTVTKNLCEVFKEYWTRFVS